MKKIILSLCCLFYVLPALAAPPKYVWRVDSFPPRVVFRIGFNPVGNNMNFPDHFLSISFDDRSSGFIGSTDSFEAAREFAEDVLGNDRLTAVYLYRVRATDHFYNAVDSIEDHIESMPLASRIRLPIYVERLERGIDSFSWEREWFSDAAIPANTIQFAYRVIPRRDYYTEQLTGVTVIEDPINNSGYVEEDTQANSSPYPIAVPEEEPYPPCELLLGECSSDSYSIDSPLNSDAMSVYMDPNCTGPSSSKMKRDTEKCNPNEFNLSLETRKKFLLLNHSLLLQS